MMKKEPTKTKKSSVISKNIYIASLAKADNLEVLNSEKTKIIPRKGIYVKYVKRCLDLVITIPLLILLFPVNLILAVLTCLDVGRPIFFRQKRIGKDGKLFYLTKFRNMTEERDSLGNLYPPEKRVTEFGKFVRKYSLDELLNFWSILKGDMSLIGPRPLPAEFRDRFSDRHKARELVRPGLECPEICGNQSIRHYQEQFENDIWYVEHVSFFVDCKMILGLIKMVFNRGERSDHAVVGGGEFLGYDRKGRAFSMRNIPEEYENNYQDYLKTVGGREKYDRAFEG